MKEAKYEIRPIRKTDDAAIAAIIRKSLEDNGLNIPGTAYYDKELDHLSAFYGEKPEERAYFVLTNREGKVVGGAGFAEFPAIPGCAEVQKLYLDAGVKRIGLGMGLMETVENYALSMGYLRLYLETSSKLTDAIRLYERMGYKKVTKPVGAVHPAMDRFYLKLLTD